MAKATKSAAKPFSGYHQSEVPAEDAELAHVGPRTPCGEYMRRFWHPVALTAEVGQLPVPVRNRTRSSPRTRTLVGRSDETSFESAIGIQ